MAQGGDVRQLTPTENRRRKPWIDMRIQGPNQRISIFDSGHTDQGCVLVNVYVHSYGRELDYSTWVKEVELASFRGGLDTIQKSRKGVCELRSSRPPHFLVRVEDFTSTGALLVSYEALTEETWNGKIVRAGVTDHFVIDGEFVNESISIEKD